MATLTQLNMVTIQPTYKVGDKASYQMSMTEHLDSADADVEAAWTETVTKAEADGSVELNAAYSNFHISANGMDIPAPEPEARTFHFSEGKGVSYKEDLAADSSVSHMLPELFGMLISGIPLQSGADTQITIANSGNYAGTARLEEVKDGIAKVSLKLTVKEPGVARPMHVDGTETFTIADGKLESFKGTFLDLPPNMTSRYNVQSAEFKLKRL
jgi:hypothetical protein